MAKKAAMRIKSIKKERKSIYNVIKSKTSAEKDKKSKKMKKKKKRRVKRMQSRKFRPKMWVDEDELNDIGEGVSGLDGLFDL